MNVAALQMVSGTGQADNLRAARALLEQAARGGAVLAVLPEYFCLMGHRDTEKLARGAKPAARKTVRRDGERDTDIAALEHQLGDLLGLNVRISHGQKGGTLTLAYSTLDQLDMVCQRLTGEHI